MPLMLKFGKDLEDCVDQRTSYCTRQKLNMFADYKRLKLSKLGS
jgi:hypothetical protein